MPSLKKLHDEIQTMKHVNLILGKKAREQLKDIEKNMNRLLENAEKYNEYFSEKGWVLYDSISTILIEKAVQIYEECGYEEAEQVLLNYYKNDICVNLLRLKNGNAELSIRYENLLRAYGDHVAERYHASVPQFLMIADGAVNDYTQKQGFFAEGTDVDAWDCLVGSTEGLQKLKGIYSKSRKKTTVEQICLPYRNGILHGRDLNYANEIVSCKCLAMLFAIHDWMLNKKTEEKRKDDYEKSLKPPSWGEIIKVIKKNEVFKNTTKSWEKQDIIIATDIPKYGVSSDYSNFSYIQYLIEAFEAWEGKNYGNLSIYFDNLFNYENNKSLRPRECRKMFQDKEFKGLN